MHPTIVLEKSLALSTSFQRPGIHIVRIADNKVVSAIGKGTPFRQHDIFSVENFLLYDNNSVSLSSAERLLRKPDCNIPLLGEHKLIWVDHIEQEF